MKDKCFRILLFRLLAVKTDVVVEKFGVTLNWVSMPLPTAAELLSVDEKFESLIEFNSERELSGTIKIPSEIELNTHISLGNYVTAIPTAEKPNGWVVISVPHHRANSSFSL